MDLQQIEARSRIDEIIADRKRRRRRTMPPELPAVRILIVEREWVNGRMTVILVREPIGI